MPAISKTTLGFLGFVALLGGSHGLWNLQRQFRHRVPVCIHRMLTAVDFVPAFAFRLLGDHTAGPFLLAPGLWRTHLHVGDTFCRSVSSCCWLVR